MFSLSSGVMCNYFKVIVLLLSPELPFRHFQYLGRGYFRQERLSAGSLEALQNKVV